MNDIKNHLDDDNIQRLLYADDLQIYTQVPVDKTDFGISCLSVVAKNVLSWAESNYLTLNARKTQAILFGSPAAMKPFKELNVSNITINNKGDSVPFVKEILNLGLILDQALSWHSQVIQVTKKINFALYSLKIIRSCTSQHLRKRLAEALVLPNLDYCNVVYADVSSKLKAQLQRLSKACIWYIMHSSI